MYYIWWRKDVLVEDMLVLKLHLFKQQKGNASWICWRWWVVSLWAVYSHIHGTNAIIYHKETPEQREGAFSNFRISPVTINKLQGEYDSDIFLIQCII